jgi:hypothetical protein
MLNNLNYSNTRLHDGTSPADRGGLTQIFANNLCKRWGERESRVPDVNTATDRSANREMLGGRKSGFAA